MAIAPKDLLALTPEDQEAVKKLESGIDEKLSAHHEPGSQSRFNLTNIADLAKVKLSYKLKKELEARYEAVGWQVAFEQSGMNDFIVLAEALKPPAKAVPQPGNIVTVPDPQAPPVGAPGFPSDDDIMAEVLGRPVEPRVTREPGTTRPPVITPMTRHDPDNPYSRNRLSSR